MSRPQPPKRSNPGKAALGVGVLTALGAGAVGLALADGPSYTPILSIIAMVMCAGLFPGKRRRPVPGKGWRVLGVLAILVNLALIVVGMITR